MGNYTAENEPLEDMKELLEDNWEQFKEHPLPIVVISNDPDDAASRINLNEGDHIIIKMEGSENIKYRGNIKYRDSTFPIVLEVQTKESRQRLRDLWRQIKAICFDNLHDFPNWQLIRLVGYTEMVNANLSIWKAIIRINLESAGVAVETNV